MVQDVSLGQLGGGTTTKKKKSVTFLVFFFPPLFVTSCFKRTRRATLDKATIKSRDGVSFSMLLLIFVIVL